MELIAYLVVALLVAGYTYYQTRKMQKKNSAKPNSQLDGSIAEEGASFSDIAGSPHMYSVITWIGNKDTHAIKSGGSKK